MLIMLNCHNRDHAEVFERADAFFDLDRDKHGSKRSMLYPCATCCVLSYEDINNKSGNIVLSYWQHREEFSYEDLNAWGLAGRRIGKVVIPKAELAKLEEFEGVIARDGDFNQFCVKVSAK